MIRVVVVDDQQLMREGMKHALNGRDDITVVGEAASGPAALVAVEHLNPDVVVMDLRMPEGDGIAATRELSRRTPPVPVLAITNFDMNEEVLGAIKAGATSLVLKDFSPDELAEAVRVTARNESTVAPSVLRRVLRDHARRLTHVDIAGPAPVTLKPRELDLLHGLAEGKSNHQIAKELSVTPATVKNAISRMAAKYGLRGRTHLALWAIRNDYIP